MNKDVGFNDYQDISLFTVHICRTYKKLHKKCIMRTSEQTNSQEVAARLCLRKSGVYLTPYYLYHLSQTLFIICFLLFFTVVVELWIPAIHLFYFYAHCVLFLSLLIRPGSLCYKKCGKTNSMQTDFRFILE